MATVNCTTISQKASSTNP